MLFANFGDGAPLVVLLVPLLGDAIHLLNLLIIVGRSQELRQPTLGGQQTANANGQDECAVLGVTGDSWYAHMWCNQEQVI